MRFDKSEEWVLTKEIKDIGKKQKCFGLSVGKYVL